jgi:hypothetical protein
MTKSKFNQSVNGKAANDIKTELHEKFQNDPNSITDCDFNFLMDILARYETKIKNINLDKLRVNVIKDNLVLMYDGYKKKLPDVTSRMNSEAKLKSIVSCYLDYMVNPKYEPVGFFDFFSKLEYLPFPCK